MPPGPIQNQNLFIELEKKLAINTESKKKNWDSDLPTIKRDLVIEKDYKTVCKEVWEKFNLIYGGGPAIIRLQQNIYSDPAPEEVEAYKLLTNIQLTQSPRGVIKVQKLPQKLDGVYDMQNI